MVDAVIECDVSKYLYRRAVGCPTVHTFRCFQQGPRVCGCLLFGLLRRLWLFRACVGFVCPLHWFAFRRWSFAFGLGRARCGSILFFLLFGASRWFWSFASSVAVVSFVLFFGLAWCWFWSHRVTSVLVFRALPWFLSCAVASFYFPFFSAPGVGRPRRKVENFRCKIFAFK